MTRRMIEHERPVVVVDDDADFRALVVMHLEARGIPAVGAAGGREALRLVRERPVTIIVSDVRMPGMDGHQLRAAVEIAHPDVEVHLWSAARSRDPSVNSKKLAVLDDLIQGWRGAETA